MDEQKDDKVLSPAELEKALRQEREWLQANNGVSAVTDGPVEDLEGVPLPGDLFQGTPATHETPN
jgi:hypothetical protein